MTKHLFRNIICLILLYCLIILGIFAVQFRNQTLLRKIIGPLRINIAYEKDSSGSTILKNNFQIVYKGLDVFFNDVSPVTLLTRAGAEEILSPVSYTENDSSITVNLTGDVSLTFSVNQLGDTENFLIKADMPRTASGLRVPYRTSRNSFAETAEKKVLLTTEESRYVFEGGSSYTASNFTLTQEAPSSHYTIYVPEKTFSLASIEKLPLAQEAAYRSSVSRFRTSSLAIFKQNLNATVTERTVIAFLAEVASQGSYAAGLDAVPVSFKDGNTRTYLSAPYLNTLTRMSRTFYEAETTYMSEITAEIQAKDAAVFKRYRAVPYLVNRGQTALLTRMFQIPASAGSFQPDTETAAGILAAYSLAKKLAPAQATAIEPIITVCEQVLTASFVQTADRLYIQSQPGKVNTQSSLRIARSLFEYGNSSGNRLWTQAGYGIVNSLFAAESDLQNGNVSSLQEEYILSEDGVAGTHSLNPAFIYPLIVTDNTFYPHELRITPDGTPGVAMRAWTIAQSVTMQKNAAGNVTISVKFPQGDTHYMMISGVEPFARIQLYGIDYRTDPRFESYNSSGYIYDRENKTLLLKMRHKSAVEEVRLIYTENE